MRDGGRRGVTDCVDSPREFLVIDANERSRLRVVATLKRKFPDAVITEPTNVKEAFSAENIARMDAVIGVFSECLDARVFVRLVRCESTFVPVIVISEMKCRREVLADGATRFLGCDEWLLAGNVLSEVLNCRPNSEMPVKAGSSGGW